MMKLIVCAGILACGIGTAQAASVALSASSWEGFDVDPLSAVDESTSWINADDGSITSFTLTTAVAGVLKVVDLGNAGDTFNVSISGPGGTQNLTTSAVGATSSSFVSLNGYDAALANPDFSRGLFDLGPGTYTITGSLLQSALVGGFELNATSGAVEFSPVPLPGALPLLLSGLFGFGIVRRRRARNLLLAAIGVLGATAASAQTTVKIIAFNDFHGNLQSPGNFIGVPAGGVDVLAGYVAKLKSQNPYTVTVHAGDMSGASPLISAFFYDEGAIESINRVGVDFASVGNHEFDFGKIELLRKQNGGCSPADPSGQKLTCQGATVGTPVPFEGAKFKYLAANVFDTAANSTLFPPYAIKTFSTPAGRVRLAFIGMTLQATPTIVTPSGVAGLNFTDEATTVNALVPRLRALGAQAIVVVVHQGGFNSGAISSCPGDVGNTDKTNPAGLAGSDIAKIVNRLDDAVDLVVSAHTHNAYICQVPNGVGRKIPVTSASAFGRVLTDINLTIDPNVGHVTAITASNTIVDNRPATLTAQGITPNPAITGIITGYANLVAPLSSKIIGNITADVPNTRDSAGDNPAGRMIADAQLQATQAQAAPAQFAMMNPGGVRVNGFLLSGTTPAGSGNVSYGQAFTVQPFGNSLVTVTLTGQQIKDALEQQFNGCSVEGLPAQNGGTKILLVSAGFNWSWDNTRALCDKVVSVSLNGSPIYGAGANLTQTYRVTINNFLSTGGDNFTVFKSGTDVVGGSQDIDALANYMAGFKLPDFPAYSPAAFPPRITRIDSGTTFP